MEEQQQRRVRMQLPRVLAQQMQAVLAPPCRPRPLQHEWHQQGVPFLPHAWVSVALSVVVVHASGGLHLVVVDLLCVDLPHSQYVIAHSTVNSSTTCTRSSCCTAWQVPEQQSGWRARRRTHILPLARAVSRRSFSKFTSSKLCVRPLSPRQHTAMGEHKQGVVLVVSRLTSDWSTQAAGVHFSTSPLCPKQRPQPNHQLSHPLPNHHTPITTDRLLRERIRKSRSAQALDHLEEWDKWDGADLVPLER